MKHKIIIFTLPFLILATVCWGSRFRPSSGGGGRGYQPTFSRAPAGISQQQRFGASTRMNTLQTQRTNQIGVQRQRIQTAIQERRAAAVQSRERHIAQRQQQLQQAQHRTASQIATQKQAQRRQLVAKLTATKKAIAAAKTKQSKAVAAKNAAIAKAKQLSLKQRVQEDISEPMVAQAPVSRGTGRGSSGGGRFSRPYQAFPQPAAAIPATSTIITKGAPSTPPPPQNAKPRVLPVNAAAVRPVSYTPPKGVATIAERQKQNQSSQDQKRRTARLCFVAGTMVKTISGLRPIETIQPGDLVWSRDEESGNEGWQPVMQTFETHPSLLTHLVYKASNSDTLGLITGTPNHPFWSEDRKAWVNMEELSQGERLRSDSNGNFIAVVRLDSQSALAGENFTTYNFEVFGWHTYFVAPKNSPPESTTIWVHNEGDKLCPEGQRRLAEIAKKGGLSKAEKILAKRQVTNSSVQQQKDKLSGPERVGAYVPAPKEIKGILGLQRAKPKTHVQGGGGMRRRWKDSDGNIYEWDSRHGALEKYNKRGQHLGEYDADTGKLLKPADPGRKVEP